MPVRHNNLGISRANAADKELDIFVCVCLFLTIVY